MSGSRWSYDRVAPRYAHEISNELGAKPLDRGLLDALAELAAGGQVADVGCGPGHVAAYLRYHGASTIAIDLSPVMCTLARRATGLPVAAADMTALPIGSSNLAALVCLYAVIHLDERERASAYSEFARVLRPGGYALVAFHVFDDDVATGGAKPITKWWGYETDLIFRYLDPSAELSALADAGFEFTARLDRGPNPEVEHPSHRSYLLVRRG